jgi:hypothetical protein
MDGLSILNAVTSGATQGAFQDEKIINIATYINNMYARNGYYFNFGDGSAKAEIVGVREFMAAEAIKNDSMKKFVAENWHKETTEEQLLCKEYSLFHKAQALQYAHRVDAYQNTTKITRKNKTYPSVGISIYHDSLFDIAVNHGNNGTSHNHNDSGNVIIYKQGHPVLIDVGVETYTSKSFSPERYEIWTMQSCYHNLSSFGSHIQGIENGVFPKDVQHRNTETFSEISFDLAPLYGNHVPDLQHYYRTVRFEKNKNILIKDVVGRNATLSLMVCDKPEIEYKTNTILLNNGFASLTLSNANTIQVETISTHNDANLTPVWGATVYRILIDYSNSISVIIQ